MPAKIFDKMKGDRKFFTIVFFILLLILLVGIITPLWVNRLKVDWNKELGNKIENIQSSVTATLNERENDLLKNDLLLRDQLRKVLNPRNSSFGDLIRLVNNSEFENYSIEVLAPNGKLIAWSSDIAVPQNDILPLAFPAGHIHFYNGELITFLTVTDTVLSENDLFYYVISLPIEKHYSLQNPYYKEVNFSKELSDKFGTQFNINYSPFAEGTRDGRKYSFDLLNSFNDKIGDVTFFKPILDSAVDSVYQVSDEVQSIFTVFAIFFFALGFRKEFKELKYRTVKFLIFSFYCAGFRIILYNVGFPSNLIQGALVDPAYFSSTFGNGIVKSPIEFFITALFVLLVCIRGFLYLADYIRTDSKKKSYGILWFTILFFPITLLFLLTLRGLSASVRSIIFDSTLRYFKEPDLIPNLPSMMMNLNLLMLGTAMVILMTSYILILLAFLKRIEKNKLKLLIAGLFVVYQIFGLLFIYFQEEPLITPSLSIIFISLIFLLAYEIYIGKALSSFKFIYITLAASIISITLLNYFNLELERVSLKTTALEINRPNDNLLRFLLNETLNNAASNEEVVACFYDRNSNYDAEAFKLWANSSLQKESLNSSLNIFDKNKNRLGSFNSGIDFDLQSLKGFNDYDGDASKIIETYQPGDSTKRIFAEIVPVVDRGMKIGYLTAAIGFDLQNIGLNNIPDFLESKRNIINSVIDINQLEIFEFSDSKLIRVYGDIYPSRDQIKPILNAKLSADNETWLELPLNDEYYYAYILKTNSAGTSDITAVLTKEKRLSWNMFNFFKIFLVHSIFIIFLLFFLLAFRIKNLKYSFRAQLLAAFLFISIVPVVFLAIYNRQIIKQRTQSAIQNELSERLNYVVNIIDEELKESPTHDYIEAFDNAGKDLGISFAVYEGSTQIFNSKKQYFNVGLFTDKLNPEVYYQLNYLNYRDYLARESIDNFDYDSFYKKISLEDRPLIIGVNDAFNKVRLTYSVMDIDVFMFGIYSFATLIMIILSAFLANRISLPIRRLTKATTSVAHGDFNVKIKSNVKGELKDLFSGFNLMTSELQRNQNDLAELERENAWKEMAKQVAHEIKNPLTPMKLAVQQLIVSYQDKNKNFNSVFEKVTKTILSQIENLSLIASEFSRFARMPNFKMEKVDLLPVLNDTINLFTDEQIKIDVITTEDRAVIEADRSQFRRMLINLIRNSIQAGAKKIMIKLDLEDGQYNILFSDDGKGIPENIKDKIFESNFTTKNKGMGLGLKLTKRFIEGINGSISLADGTKNGAAFKITIPRFQKK